MENSKEKIYDLFPKTDLAVETHELNAEKGVDDGMIVENYTVHGIEVSEAKIKKGRGEEISGKRAGVYITADIGELYLKTKKQIEETALGVSFLVKKLVPAKEGCVLVAGIGNEEIISDAIGPKTVSGIIATRHLKKHNERLYKSLNFCEVVTVQTGVMGNTGMESGEMISALVEKLTPKCVIAVDSLASRRLSRLATTVQISDGGISPGAGVANRRLTLNEETLGVPVIAVGMPTVVDAFTLVYDLTGDEKYKELYGGKDNFYVAPKETDRIIKDASKLLSASLNMALHGLNFNDLEDLR